MKIKALKTFVCGSIDAAKGEILDISEKKAKMLISKKFAESCEEAPEEQSQEAEAPEEQSQEAEAPETASKKTAKAKSGSK